MIFKRLEIPDVIIIEPTVFEDERGYFFESYQQEKFKEMGINVDFVQDNQSLSVKAGTLRGLHYQVNPKAQAKIVRVITGAIFDVAVDIRKNSPTFKKWVSVVLTAENKRQIFIPKGFAHGICTLAPNTEILYKIDEFYSKAHERCIRWDDPDINIKWPLDNIGEITLSEKDKNALFLKNAFIVYS
jgi:dTDP-4-dehydrorhamnose 3,5-epimerase